MTTRTAIFGAALLMTLALAGCSSSPAAPASATVAPSATPTADLRPWASAIAKQSAALDDAQQELTDAGCSASTANDVTCGARLTATSFQMQTIATEIESISTPKAQSYIGDVPAEIASLYSDTQTAANAAASAGEAWTDGDCIGSDSLDCLRVAGDLTNAMETLSGQFTAWSPYS